MKISTHLLFDRGSSQMSNVQSQLTQSQAQLAQGKQIINASDAPNQAATIQRLKSILNKQDSYQSSLNTIKARLQGEDSTLQNVSDLLVRAKEVAVQGGNDTLNAWVNPPLGVKLPAPDAASSDANTGSTPRFASLGFATGGSACVPVLNPPCSYVQKWRSMMWPVKFLLR